MTNKEFDEILERTNAVVCSREWYERAAKALEQEPSEDCVSRAELKKWLDMNFSFGGALRKLELFDRLDKELPSVTPTRKKGKWEFIGDNCFKCSECGEVYTVDQFNHINNYCDNRFPKGCPNCATEMESE